MVVRFPGEHTLTPLNAMSFLVFGDLFLLPEFIIQEEGGDDEREKSPIKWVLIKHLYMPSTVLIPGVVVRKPGKELMVQWVTDITEVCLP